jgi:predicted nucleic acid-binding protein
MAGSLLSYLLDTNFVSQSAKSLPNKEVDRWLERNDARLMFLSVITVTELRVGMEMMPVGKRRNSIAKWLEETVIPHFDGRILPVTIEIAAQCGVIWSAGRRAGANVDPFDALIAATATVHGFSVATLNRNHFVQVGATLVDF